MFTEEQAEAIARREGPLLLSAAAGSGKTSVLVERFVRMVVDDGIAPGRILVITFTEKAAGELRSRIRAGLLARGERMLAQDAEAAWIGTFHGFCARVLRAHAVAAGLDPAFSVLDEAAGRELRERSFEDALAGLLGPPEAAPRHDALDLVAAYTPDRLKRAVLDLHGQLRSAGQGRPELPPVAPAPDAEALRPALEDARAAALRALEGVDGRMVAAARDCIEARRPFKPGRVGALLVEECEAYRRALEELTAATVEADGARALALVDELLQRYGDAYAARKRARSAVDFDDLELQVAALLDRDPGLARAWRERFERIMVDEFQDTNALQVGLLARLDGGHLFRVGDELQSIYGFRHASVEIFRAASEGLERAGALALLRRNFRARAEILAAINAANAVLHPAAEPLVSGRGDPPAGEPLVELLLTDVRNGEWDAVGESLGALPGGPAWRWAEARALAARIRELVDGDVCAGDVVVLVRAATDIACYERALEEQGLSTLAAGGRGFWARQQVQDLTSHLAALANPRDEPALLGVLASPIGPRLSSDALALLAVGARRASRGLWEHVESGDWTDGLARADADRLRAWADAFAAERARAPRLSLAELLTRAVVAARYDEHVLRLPGGVRRLANVRKLVRLAAAYEAESGRGVRGFIDRATAELEAEAREPDAPVELEGYDAVRLMTIHAAKGLEFPVVAVADLGRDPHTQLPDVLTDGERVGLRVVTLTSKANTGAYEVLKAERQARDREEALRVLHVAVTRAQERLILSGAANAERWPSGDGCAPIGWLFPAFLPDVAARLLEEGPVIEEGGIRATLVSPPESATPVAAGPVASGSGAPPPSSGALRLSLAPPAEGAPPVTPPVGTLSYSALSRYAQCGYRFYLERVLRLPEKEAPRIDGRPAAPAGLDPLTRGSIVHELLERLVEPTAEEIRAQAARHELELSDDEAADVARLVRAALGSPVLQRALAATTRHVEEAFALALTGAEHAHVPLFTGFLDLRAVEADGAMLVVDYKTDHLGDTDPEEVVRRGYGVQRRLYALAALRAGAPRVEVAHLFLDRPETPATARYEAADVARLESELAAEAGDLLAGRFAVAPLPHRELCATCPGRGGLCSWPEERVLQDLAEA